MATRPVSALPTPESQQAQTKSVRATPNPPPSQDKVTLSEAAQAEQAQASTALPKGGASKS
jgi:hypothetical protein